MWGGGTVHTVFELRRYLLMPGARERMITLFDEELVDPQIGTGIAISGQYRDLDDPDAFVWFRSFEDMETRQNALTAFYDGPTWKQFGPLANATMVNSDNVLLLRPAIGAEPFTGDLTRPAEGGGDGGLVCVSTCSVAPGRDTDIANFFSTEVAPLLTDAGARLDAAFVSERAANTYPRLPVREGETVFLWVASFADTDAHRAFSDRLAVCAAWSARVFPKLDAYLWRPLETVRLSPTARSRHRWWPTATGQGTPAPLLMPDKEAAGPAERPAADGEERAISE